MQTNNLGTLEELPEKYRKDLTELNLVPLWPNMRSVLPYNAPVSKTLPMNWDYKSIRPLLMESGELTPIEKAERRVLIMANPGHGLENLQATPSIYLGLQLILPGETAPNHRHTPNAVRIIVEGEGAYTVVDGEPCRMERGDLILTPSGFWHEHRHEGQGPIVWLDILDLPLIYQLDSSYALDGEPQQEKLPRDKSFAEYSAAGVVPRFSASEQKPVGKMLRYPWQRTRNCLVEMSKHYSDELLRIDYVDPETGRSLFPSIGFGAVMLRPGEKVTLPKTTTSYVFHIVEGSGSLQVNADSPIDWNAKDTLSAPGYVHVTLTNHSHELPAFLITADEAPLHKYLGIF